ncbi:MAG: hypothetical protein SH847_26740 [Roseiflexaceae bacterium]|nr:hypothetical protein [Roseiflexaceae bacterium]
MARRLIRLKPGFDDTLARAGYAVREFARFAEIPHQTLFALIHPEYQSKTRSLGGMQKKTAWRLAQAYARVTDITDDEAYRMILLEEELVIHE